MKSAHIVPRMYLRNWSIDGRIGVCVVPEGRSLVQPIENVGTRFRFYRRERPDGTPIDDIEWSLGELEGIVAPVLRGFQDSWPLGDESKAKLAELSAFQVLRGPRYKEEYETRTRDFIDEYNTREGLDIDDEQLAAADKAMTSDSYRFMRMLPMSLTLTSIFVSMHWTLVEFPEPVLATSDHPVVMWPGAGQRSPVAAPIVGSGLLECVEFRLPLSATCGLLMTWADKADDEDARVAGSRQHAMNFNAFAIASADRQWFHQPGTSAPRGAGKMQPLSLELVRGYTSESARDSERRAQVSAHVNGKIGRDLSDREVMHLKVTSRASM